MGRGWITIVAGCGLTLAMGAGVGAQAPATDPGTAAEISDLLRAVPLVDGHNDAPWAIRDRFSDHLSRFDFHDTSRLEKPMQTDLDRMRAGGVGAQFWSVWVPTDLSGGEAVTTVLEQIDLVHRLIQRYPDDLELALTADDVRRIHREGRIASLIGVEGGHSINDSLAVLRQLWALGARYMTLTHWSDTDWADAATDAPRHGGLTPFGEAVVREMNRLGMMVDLSHVSEETMRDALAVSRAPVIFSHSDAFALDPHPRNVPDDVLRLVAANGGIVMATFAPAFLSGDAARRWAAATGEEARLKALYPGDPERAERELQSWLDTHPAPEVTVAAVADHIEHIRDVAGIDHVGLGSDFDGISATPKGLADVSGYPDLLAELARRGWSRHDLAKVAGENLLRVMAAVEGVATRLQRTEQPSELRFAEMEGAAASAAPDHH